MKIWTIEAWLPSNPYEPHDKISRYTEEEATTTALEMVDKHPQCRVYVRYKDTSTKAEGCYNQDGRYEYVGRPWKAK